LGRLEALAVQFAGITGRERPRGDRRLVAVFAADHGVAADGVSAYPQAVTGQMVGAFAGGRAAVSVLARQAGARLVVVDVGVASPLPPDLPIRHRRVRPGTASFLVGPAMCREEALAALAVGVDTVEEALADGEGLDLLALGEMGIGNTTAAAAVTAGLLGLPAEAVVGRGTGVDDAGLARKRAVVAAGLAHHRPDPADPVGVLAAVGGLEIAALAGAILRAAAARVPVLLDGYVVGAAALAAVALAPAARSCLLAAHRSPEPGHGPVLAALGLEPLLDLGMRLGEGSGAALALPLVAAALAAHAGMATFAEAGVSGRDDAEEEPARTEPARHDRIEDAAVPH
jgi:nicotinate-nucleotide--dimethylbenzimidazole phosphoribosyltransferase